MKTIGQLVFTAVEALTVAGWLALTGVNAILAIIVLFLGFILEHFISFNVKNQRPLFHAPANPIGNQLVLAGVETITWAGWLALTTINPVVAAAVLFGGLLVGHIAESNSVNDFPLFHRFGNRLKKTLDISAIEAIIAIVWLALTPTRPVLAFGILFGGLFVEHFVSGLKKFLK